MKNKNIIIILFLVIVLLGGYIGYDLIVVHKEDNCKVDNDSTNNIEYSEHSVVVSAYDGIKTFHVKAENNCENEDLTLTSIVSIPKLVKNTKNTKEFNRKIYDELKEKIEFINKKINDELSYAHTSYEYTVIDDIVYIWVNNSTSLVCGGSGFSISDYYYDLKNDKELTLKEVYDKNNIKLNDIVNKFKSGHPEEKDYIPNKFYPIIPDIGYSSGFNIFLEDYGIDGLDMYLSKRELNN